MKLRVEPITVGLIFATFLYGASVTDRAVEGGDLSNFSKDKVVAVVKHDVKVVKADIKKVKNEIKKINHNNTPVYNK